MKANIKVSDALKMLCGLTRLESIVYLLLVEHGSLPVFELNRLLKRPPRSVGASVTLMNLKKKGYVETEKVKNFVNYKAILFGEL